MKAFYQRISTIQQSTARQEKKAARDEKIFTDKISGAVPFGQRPGGKELLDAVDNNEINHLTVSSIDRLGRDVFDIQKTINYLTEKGVTVQVSNLGDLKSLVNGVSNPMFKMITDVLANVSQMERDSIKERQAEGIAIGKSRGVYRGRPVGTGKTAQELVDENKDIVKRLKDGTSIRDTGTLTGKSPTTVQRVKKAMAELKLEKDSN